MCSVYISVYSLILLLNFMGFPLIEVLILSPPALPVFSLVVNDMNN